VLDGTLASSGLASVLARVGVDPELRPEIETLAKDAGAAGGVERIFINLARRSPPGVFRLYGARVVPTFNYFQTALVLAAESYVDAEDVSRVAGSLIDRSGYTPRRLENSLADLVRRHLLDPDAASLLADPLREAGVLPASGIASRPWFQRMRNVVQRRRRRLVSSIPRVTRATPLDYDAILDRLAAARASA